MDRGGGIRVDHGWLHRFAAQHADQIPPLFVRQGHRDASWSPRTVIADPELVDSISFLVQLETEVRTLPWVSSD